MITVIVDTSATFVDVMMKSTRWMQLLTLAHDSKVQLVVPDVVLRETARHWEAEAVKAIEIANGKIVGLKKSRDRLSDLGLDGSSLVDSSPVTAEPDSAQFEQERRDMLVSLGVDARAVPKDIDIEAVLQRDLARKKPFNEAGKGFRDTLVWETVKEVVMESDAGKTIILVTDNTGDYCDDAGKIAPELLAEVNAAAGELTRVDNLEALLSHVKLAPLVSGLAKTDEELATFLALASDPYGCDAEPLPVGQVVKNAVVSAIEQLAGEEVETNNESTSGYDFTGLNVPGELEGLSIDTIAFDDASLTWQTYETYDDSTLLIQAEVDAEISLVGFAYKSDAVHLAEEDEIYVLDWDWNNHMTYVEVTTKGRLRFQVRLEQGMDHADECELESAVPIPSHDDTHPWHEPK